MKRIATLLATLAIVLSVNAQQGLLQPGNLALVWSQVELRPHRDAAILVNYLMNAIATKHDNYTQNLEWAERHLLDVTDTLYCEEMMTMMLEHADTCSALTADERVRPHLLLDDLRKNRIGTIAAPIRFVDMDDREVCVNDLSTQYKLVLFYDPECDDCHHVMERIVGDSLIMGMVERSELTVFAVYGGDDAKAWRRNHVAQPLVKGWSKGLYDGEDYYVPGYPLMYLLAADNTVLLKNEPSLNRVIKVLTAVRADAGATSPAALARSLFNQR